MFPYKPNSIPEFLGNGSKKPSSDVSSQIIFSQNPKFEDRGFKNDENMRHKRTDREIDRLTDRMNEFKRA
jgi:hypothetical protein